MINIFFLLSHTEKGGGEVLIYNLIKNIDRSHFKPFVGHVDFRKGEFIYEFRKLGVEPVDFRASHLRNLPITLLVILRIVSFIRNNAIDIVCSNGAHNHIYAALAKRLTGIPIVSFIWNYYQARLENNPLIFRIALRLGADYYLAPSYSCLKPLSELIPQTIPYKVIYPMVDKDFICAEDKSRLIRSYLGLNNKNKLICVIARLQPWKGQDIFIRASSLIAKAHPEARFCLVGGALFGMDKDYPKELQYLINNLGLTGHCWIVGHQNNVRDWISASDIIVHPTIAPEPGGLAVIEAMSLGKSVVATSCGGPEEFIEDGLTGLFCQSNSAEDLAAKVIKLLDDGNLAKKIKEAAQSIALKRFTADKITREIEEVFREVAPKTRKKCILFTLSSRKRSGHEMSMRNIIKVLDTKRFKATVVFLCLKQEGALPEELRKMGIEVFVKRIGRLRQPLNLLRAVYWLSSLIKERDIKLVFSAGGHNHPYSRIAALITNRPIITHETFIFKRYFWQNGPILSLDFLLGTDAYISSGRLALETLCRASLWKAPVYYLPYMVDLDIFDYSKSATQIRKSLNIPQDAFVFSMLARIQEWKGQDIFIEAAMRLLSEESNIYFLVFGEPTFAQDAAYFNFLKKKVESSVFREKIIFAGFLEDGAYAYAASDVICHCSKTPDPYPMVILEAFAMKKTVIATACGGPLESVTDNKDGWLISPGNAKELLLAMKRALRNRNYLTTMGESGYQKVRKVYNQQQFALKINSIISEYILN